MRWRVTSEKTLFYCWTGRAFRAYDADPELERPFDAMRWRRRDRRGLVEISFPMSPLRKSQVGVSAEIALDDYLSAFSLLLLRDYRSALEAPMALKRSKGLQHTETARSDISSEHDGAAA